MAQLEEYEIPPDILDLEFNDNHSRLKSIQENFHESRTSLDAYIGKFSALIHMEEAANSKHLAGFDLKNVQLSLHSHPDKMFKFSHGDYQKYYRAWRKGTIDAFTAKKNGSQVETLISGKIFKIDTHYILFKVDDGFEDLVCWFSGEAQLFKVSFNINRIVYQLQHNALMWIKEHGLFSILIDNPRYERTSTQKPEGEFRFVISY